MSAILMLGAGLVQGLMFGYMDATPFQLAIGMATIVAAFIAGKINL